MGGFFGVIKHSDCVNDLFYGVDYNFHMGNKRGGMVTINKENHFVREIHNIENAYFRNKFEDSLANFSGKSGIGVISDTDAQPIMMNCHLGKFAIVTVARINNLVELEKEFLEKGNHFSEHSSGAINQTEFMAMLINEGKTFVEGIENVFNK
ncbi:MAG TPA: amidophosphoribosyltransferase, partial [Bacteroidales bacterium]|nr:amidophosphoribosyltransferase [Bacteroidales bacterium]